MKSPTSERTEGGGRRREENEEVGSLIDFLIFPPWKESEQVRRVQRRASEQVSAFQRERERERKETVEGFGSEA